MATSGTIGQTRLRAIDLIEIAVRRCGLIPERLSAEHLEIAHLDLYTLITYLATKGLQLWCIEQRTFSLATGQGNYAAPDGVQSVANAVFRQPTLITHPTTTIVTTTATAPFSATDVAAVAYTTTVSGTLTVSVAVGVAGIYTTVCTATVAVVAGIKQWFVLDTLVEAADSVRITETSAASILSGVIDVASAVVDTPMQPMSRDEWANQPNKLQLGNIPSLYWLERLVAPVLHIYPVTDSSDNHLIVWWKRDVEDIGALSNEVELPSRWYHTIISELSKVLSLDLPGVDPARVALLAATVTMETAPVSADEVDAGPVRIQPAIGCYTA